MVKISRLETKTQEIVLLLTIVATLSIFVGGLFFLSFSESKLIMVMGSWGASALHSLFSFLGLSMFLLGVIFFWLGRFVLIHTTELSEILGLAPRLAFQMFLQSWVIAAAASYLCILQSHFLLTPPLALDSGLGGRFGILLGGNFYSLFGLFGSLTLVTSMLIIIGIISGQIQLVSLLLHLEELLAAGLSKITGGVIDGGRRLASGVGREIQQLNQSPTTAFASSYNQVHVNSESFAGMRARTMPTDLPPYPPLASPYGYSTSLPNGHFGGVPKHQGDSNMESGSGSRIQLGKIEVPQEALLDKDLAPKKARSKRKVGDLKTSSSNSKAALDAEESSGGSADPGEGDGSDGKGIKIEISRWKGRYQAPEAVLLKKPTRGKIPSDAQIKAKCVELEERLASFQIKGTVTDAHVGASLTMYEFQPDPGVKVSKITSLSDDLALMLGASTIRILAPIPGKKTLGIEVPNDEASAVSFSSLLPALLKETKTQELPVALGLDVHNNALVVDLASMPHLLVAGTTGSGKSVFMNALISSLLFTRSPKDLRFIMIDPKMIELSPYNGIPHLLRPVVTDVTEAKNLLVWAEQEMDRRYQMFSDLQARNITSFNEKIGSSTQSQCERRAGKKISWKWAEMPYIVIVIDELADLMLTQGRDVEVPITRIAQKARAAGIHLVIATQRPSADIVTGLIKTNFPTRISFKVSSGIDSRTILDDSGAEKLLGRGDMLLLPNGQAIQRLQGCFLSESEVKKIVQSIS